AVDPRFQQCVELERGADGERAAHLLPAPLLALLELGYRLWILVEDRDLVPLREQLPRDCGADSSAAHDQAKHAFTLSLLEVRSAPSATCSRPAPARRREPPRLPSPRSRARP